ncbi:MAG: hypothetical protein AAGF12_27150 [Myxococcota bacterium]
MLTGDVLARSAMFTIVATGDLVTLRIFSRPDVTPEAGAEAAGVLRATLLGKVLVPDSSYRGVVIDLRDGPAMFGPRTRRELLTIIERAQGVGMRLAVVLGSPTVQRLQFESVAHELDSTALELVTNVADATAFVQSH